MRRAWHRRIPTRPAGTYTATLRVRDGRGGEDTATVRIDPGQHATGAHDRDAGPEQAFRGGRGRPAQRKRDRRTGRRRSASRLSWTVIKHHDTHTHPFLPPTAGNDIPITGPDPEDPSATTTTFLEIQLTATDAQGLSRTVTQSSTKRGR